MDTSPFPSQDGKVRHTEAGGVGRRVDPETLYLVPPLSLPETDSAAKGQGVVGPDATRRAKDVYEKPFEPPRAEEDQTAQRGTCTQPGATDVNT